MQPKTCFLLLMFLAPALNAQSPVWERWDAETMRVLNTASGIDYLTDEEQKVVLFMNMARYDGALFADTFLESYVEENQLKNSSELRSLYRELKRTGGLTPLVLEEDLTAVAQGHATSTGQSGQVGHRDFKKRFGPLMGNPYQQVGENIAYGFGQAIDIVIRLLIDEGVKDLGHRKNILNEAFNSVGVAIRPHKRYRVNCVTTFGRQDRSQLNEVPEFNE